MSKFVSIGGSCFFGTSTKINKNINKESYPFDFLRTHFSFIIDCIKNNFINFLPNDCSNPYCVGDLYVYNMGDHCFYHHDLRNIEIVNSFYRRFKRFNSLLEENNNNNGNEIIFLRSISNPLIKNELEMRKSFFELVNNKYPNLKYKIIFVGHRKDDDLININCEKLDNKTFIFTIGIKPIVENNNVNFDINFQKNYDKIIDFIIKNNYLNEININKIIINSNDLSYNENNFDNLNYNYNSFALDYYP